MKDRLDHTERNEHLLNSYYVLEFLYHSVFQNNYFFKVKKLRHREDKYPAESLTLETERLKFESEVAGT